MVYILTVYYNSNFWAPIQLQHLKSTSTDGAKVFAFKDERTNVNGLTSIGINLTVLGDGGVRSHAEKLNILANIVSLEAKDSDIIIFLDADAFPICKYEEFICSKLKKYDLVAVRRDEEQEPIPHPCFCATTVGFWKEIKGDWRRGPFWIDNDGYSITDVGATLHEQIRSFGREWYPLLRSNKKNLHPVFYGIYGDMIYHHGAGNRQPVSRQEVKKMNRSWLFRSLPGYFRVRVSKYYRAKIIEKNVGADQLVRKKVHDADALTQLLC